MSPPPSIARAVDCPTCTALAGQQCHRPGYPHVAHARLNYTPLLHRERLKAARSVLWHLRQQNTDQS